MNFRLSVRLPSPLRLPSRYATALFAAVTLVAAAACASPVATPYAPPSVRHTAPASVAPPVSGTPGRPTSTSSAPSPSGSQIANASGSPAAGYSTTINNPFFPLIGGTTLNYTGTKDGKVAAEQFEVRADSNVIDGVTCVVTEDRVSLAGTPSERTLGYYAQDAQGNVWSFGEDTQAAGPNSTYQTVDSWRAGLDGAPPMMIMPAMPVEGQTYEHARTSTDFQIIGLNQTQNVPAGSYTGVLVTNEWSPVEPNISVHKYYAPGVGLIRDVSIAGPYEETILQSVTGP